MNTQSTTKQRNPWAYAAIGLAAVVLMVNITFVVLSSSTNPGLVTKEYQKYGLQEYKWDAQMREQEKRGWKVNLKIPPLVEKQSAQVILDLKDHQNVPVHQAKAELIFYRPSDSTLDQTYELTEDKTHQGVYSTSVNISQKGTWDVNLLIDHQGTRHTIGNRIQVIDSDPTPKKPTLLEKIVNILRS